MTSYTQSFGSSFYPHLLVLASTFPAFLATDIKHNWPLKIITFMHAYLLYYVTESYYKQYEHAGQLANGMFWYNLHITWH